MTGVARLIDRTRGTGMTNPPGKWFGPKRIGVGLRPQTWEGWLIVLVGVLAVFVVVGLFH